MNRDDNEKHEKTVYALGDDELSTVCGAKDAWKTFHDLAWEAVDREDYGWAHFYLGACLGVT